MFLYKTKLSDAYWFLYHVLLTKPLQKEGKKNIRLERNSYIFQAMPTGDVQTYHLWRRCKNSPLSVLNFADVCFVHLLGFPSDQAQIQQKNKGLVYAVGKGRKRLTKFFCEFILKEKKKRFSLKILHLPGQTLFLWETAVSVLLWNTHIYLYICRYI